MHLLIPSKEVHQTHLAIDQMHLATVLIDEATTNHLQIQKEVHFQNQCQNHLHSSHQTHRIGLSEISFLEMGLLVIHLLIVGLETNPQ